MAYAFHKPQPLSVDMGGSTDGMYTVQPPASDTIIMHGGNDEMIRVTKDGFYVRGKKVEQDDKEAEVVYNAFKQWLAWANLQQGR